MFLEVRWGPQSAHIAPMLGGVRKALRRHAGADEIGGRYCENCHVSRVVPDDWKITPVSEGVRAYAVDPARARALWERSEEMVGERFS